YSIARSANIEAVSHFGHALRLVGSQPESPDRDRRELDLRLQHGLPLIATRGYASDEVESHYRTTVELAQRLTDHDADFASTRSLWNCVYDRANLEWSLELSNQLVRLSGVIASDADAKRTLAFRALGSTLMSRADFSGAEDAFDQCLAA